MRHILCRMTYRHDTTSLAQRARARVDAAIETSAYLETLYEEPPSEGVRAAIGAAHTSVRVGLKLAEVEALLAIAAELRELRRPLPPVGFPQAAAELRGLLNGEDR